LIGIVVTATLFMAPYYGQLTKFCLAVFSRKKNLKRYLIIHPFVEDAMFQLVCKLRALYGRVSIQLMSFHTTFFVTDLINSKDTLESSERI